MYELIHAKMEARSPIIYHLQGGEQESWWFNVVQVKSLRSRTIDELVQAKRTNSPFLCLCVLFRSSKVMGWVLPMLMTQIFFTQSTNSSANVFQKHPYRHTRDNVYQLSGHPLTQLSSHVKLTTHIQVIMRQLETY